MMQTVLQKELEQAQAQLQPISEELDQKNGKLIEIRAQHDRRLDAKRKVVRQKFTNIYVNRFIVW